MTTGRSASSGFTIVELMVSLAVAAILIGFALPAFNDFIAQRTMTARANDFVLAISYARSEAARLNGAVSVQAVNPEADNEWGGGYCVVAGNPGNCDDPVLRRFDPMDDATLDGVGGLGGRTTLTFNARGVLTPGAGPDAAVNLCSTDPGVDPGREINVSFIGRTDVEELVCNP
jgi:type IV fimbrial biogenesis protein FimT